MSLVTYLTEELHLDNAIATKNATTWLGTCFLTLLGALLADSYLGRYWTTALFFTPYFSVSNYPFLEGYILVFIEKDLYFFLVIIMYRYMKIDQ